MSVVISWTLGNHSKNFFLRNLIPELNFENFLKKHDIGDAEFGS